jgi:hypothetical protein
MEQPMTATFFLQIMSTFFGAAILGLFWRSLDSQKKTEIAATEVKGLKETTARIESKVDAQATTLGIHGELLGRMDERLKMLSAPNKE